MFDIPEVERELLIPGKRVAAVHLRPAGDPRAHFMPPRLLQAVKRQIFHQKGARPDQAHIALEHAPEARQFIQAGRTKEAAKDGYAVGVGTGNAIAIIGIAHGAEFIHSKRPPSQTGTFLNKKYRLAHVPMERNRRDNHHWRQEQPSRSEAHTSELQSIM